MKPYFYSMQVYRSAISYTALSKIMDLLAEKCVWVCVSVCLSYTLPGYEQVQAMVSVYCRRNYPVQHEAGRDTRQLPW
jgi:hypothetical protein